MIGKLKILGKLFRTVVHLKPTQVFHQIKYRIFRSKLLTAYKIEVSDTQQLSFFSLPRIANVLEVENNNYHFQFLNLSKKYSDIIDWNDQTHGKLWNYNLQYSDFLRQENISSEEKITILKSQYLALSNGQLPLEPYPVSLRIMNVVRFLSQNNQTQDKEIVNYLRAEVNYLSNRLEYHLLANHLLENAFALMMGASYFKDEKLQKKATQILKSELKEQILSDGAHFEVSPMYHQIILFRVLECFQYVPSDSPLSSTLKSVAKKMAAWLLNISFYNGDIPHFNDSAEGISFSTPELLSIANNLNIIPSKLELGSSGYRKIKTGKLELFADIHGISPSYQPGHAHADTFSYCLNYDNTPIIVDTGISTYNVCSRRDYERSTDAHNTISVNNQNSSEVWASFRVAKRVKVKILKDTSDEVIASHNGYQKVGITHQRDFKIDDKGIMIEDQLGNRPIGTIIKSNIHFHPLVKIQKQEEGVFKLNDVLLLTIIGGENIELNSYSFCDGYNNLVDSHRIEYSPTNKQSSITITII